ncbi:MAG: diacylglycerol kinase family protein [Chloroflexota bacterium]
MLAGSGIAMGIVPGGTGNLFAATLGMSRSIDRAIATLAAGTAEPCDLGWVRLETPDGEATESPFTVAVGTGFDARVIEATTAGGQAPAGRGRPLPGRQPPARPPEPAAHRDHGRRRPQRAHLGRRGDHERGRGDPGGIRPRMPVPVNDGLLHAFVLPRGGIAGSLHGLLELLLAAEPGESASGNGVRLIGRSVRVEVQPPAPVEVDGDPFEPAVLDARILPGALSVIRA